MKLRQLLLAALFAALTAIGSLIKIPVGTTMVFTLQTFFVFLTGMLLEARYAFVSMIVYMAIGLLGVPIFSTGGGIGYVLAPTFGYVIGFIVCAFLISLLVRKKLLKFISKAVDEPKSILMAKIIAFFLIALLALYVCGIGYYYLIKNLYWTENLGLWALLVNSSIFIVFDIAKFAVALPISFAVLKRLPAKFTK